MSQGNPQVCIGICSKFQRLIGMKMKTKVDSSFNVLKDSLEELKMWFSWSMQEQANLLNSVSNVLVSECEVLECSRKVAVCDTVD